MKRFKLEESAGVSSFRSSWRSYCRISRWSVLADIRKWLFCHFVVVAGAMAKLVVLPGLFNQHADSSPLLLQPLLLPLLPFLLPLLPLRRLPRLFLSYAT